MMIPNKKILVLLLCALFILKLNYGENINSLQAFSYASDFIVKINSSFESENLLLQSDYFVITENNETLAYVFRLHPQGFIAVSAFSTNTPVIGFSLYDNLPEGEILKKLPAYSIIEGIAHTHKFAGQNQKPNEYLIKTTDEVIYGPYVYTLWGQVNCHNNQGQLINVTNYYTPNNYAAGCVAISLSTLLHYYKWPPVGEGYHQYYDGWGSSTGTYEANFGETYYKWDLMLNKYNNQVSTDPQREAAGELAFHAAVALEMNFEYNGSTSNVNKIPGASADYFRFYSFYKQESSTVFWPRLDKNMVEANPVILSVENNSGFGHSVVCDGLWLTDDEERFYHLNMGWWGSGNGWFTIQEDFNAGGYTTINGGILDFIPKPLLYDVEIPADTNMFHLTWQFTQTIAADAYEVQRKINTGSWETITDDYQDTSILIVVENVADDYFFRVRAKVNDEWYPSSWSNNIQLQIITGVEDLPAENIAVIYPNPFYDNLTIVPSANYNQDVSVRIFEMEGKIVYRSGNEQLSDQINIPAGSWNKGVYIVDIKTGSLHQMFKIIKK
ncbi:MAG: C10 family peptidase [Bacteroidales bacterium]|nr:C10 family peptidase [Bacteroidales bacterium]